MPDQSLPLRYLVTGATGFIGSRLAAALVTKYGANAVTGMIHTRRNTRDEQALKNLNALTITIIECDLLNIASLRRLPQPNFDVVYHLAAFAETETATDESRVNSDGTRHLLEWLGPSLSKRHFIYTSTLAVIDPPPRQQLVTEAICPAPRTEYGRTKLSGEEAITLWQKKVNFDFTILRLCTIIGPGYRPGGMFGKCPELLKANKLAVRLNWPGRVAFLAVTDLVKILVNLPDSPASANKTFVLSNGENPTFDQLLQMMADTLTLPRRRIILPSWAWRCVIAFTWPLAGAAWTPHSLRTFCWRVTHIIRDGLSADATQLNKIIEPKYQSVWDALQETYRRK